MMAKSCGNCEYYSEQEGESYGTCRHSAPPVHQWIPEPNDSAPKVWAWWPLVTSEDWCGQFRSKDLKFLGWSVPPTN